MSPPEHAPALPRGGTASTLAPAESLEDPLLPEDFLERAMAAGDARERGQWARLGLSHDGEIDPTTQAMLLRQLYLSHYAQRDFARAYELAEQALAHDVLVDVIHQDAARARQALGDVEGAVGHLRLAARLGPPSRRAFHWWTLGSVLFLTGRHDEAVSALQRAARWGTTDKPLYQGHLALARAGAGKRVRNLSRTIELLESCPAGQGYGRFVLGHLAHLAGDVDKTRFYLESFLSRTRQGLAATAIALHDEVAMARRTLEALPR